MRDVHLFVELLDHHGFDDGQEFGRGCGRHAESIAEREGCGQIPANHRTGHSPQLAAQATDQVPDLPALMAERPVRAARAVGADAYAGVAVSVAPAEAPVGESAEAFFSCSSSSPFET